MGNANIANFDTNGDTMINKDEFQGIYRRCCDKLVGSMLHVRDIQTPEALRAALLKYPPAVAPNITLHLNMMPPREGDYFKFLEIANRSTVIIEGGGAHPLTYLDAMPSSSPAGNGTGAGLLRQTMSADKASRKAGGCSLASLAAASPHTRKRKLDCRRARVSRGRSGRGARPC